jgi:hypothetical protein
VRGGRLDIAVTREIHIPGIRTGCLDRGELTYYRTSDLNYVL